MTSQSSGSPLQVCRNCGGGAPVDVHFCPQCSQLLTLGRQGDYFTFLGLPRKLRIDAADLERRFRALSRQFHPDYFHNASPTQRRASLERSSYLNDAYRTLRDPISRVEYLLGLEGLAPKGPEDAARQVPATLLEEVFALNEELDEIRELRAVADTADAAKLRLDDARQPIQAKQAAHEKQLDDLTARWDTLLDRGAPGGERRELLEALRERLLERNYIKNLLTGIDRELAEPRFPPPERSERNGAH
jgi:molecular chaperone HscB